MPAPAIITFRPRLACWLLLALACALPGPARTQPVDEQAVQAAYVLKFLRYTEWPDDAEAGAGAEPGGRVTVLVVGPVSAARTLRSLARGASMPGGLEVAVRHVRGTGLAGEEQRARLQRAMRSAHVVFVAEDDDEHAHDATRAVLALARNRPVLTIGIGYDFVRAGGMLALVRDGGRVAFTANPMAVQQSPVKVNARVLQIARPLTDPEQDGQQIGEDNPLFRLARRQPTATVFPSA